VKNLIRLGIWALTEVLASIFFEGLVMKISAVMMVILLTLGCGDDGKKSSTNPNNVTNNSTNNTTNNGTTVNISDYDQTCQFDTNCALVSPAPCGCSCPNTGINTDDESAFNAAIAAITCAPDAPACAADCQELLPSCWESTCYARSPQVVTADDYDTSCETADDCMYIATGEVCSDCQCAATAVNRADYEANPPAPAECTPGPSVCDCAAPPAIGCNNGVCGFAEF